jgi:two-component system, OmpR family, sensor histidine kinase KdpD
MSAIGDNRLPAEASGEATVVMVCVGYNPSSQRLILRAAQLARAFRGRLIALHVARPSQAPGYRVTLEDNMALAREQGAEVVFITGSDLATSIAEAARRYRVTQLVMGESARTRWDDWRTGSIMRQVLNLSAGVDLYVVAEAD